MGATLRLLACDVERRAWRVWRNDERSAVGVDWLNWPCGQNPGRKPEGRQRASTRETMSLGEQSSTRRASPLDVRSSGLTSTARAC